MTNRYNINIAIQTKFLWNIRVNECVKNIFLIYKINNMIDNNLFIITAVNSVLIILVLFILFRLETNKVKSYLKRIDKKLDDKIKKNNFLNYDSNIVDNNIQNPVRDTNIINDNKINMNDIDSYIDPMDNWV